MALARLVVEIARAGGATATVMLSCFVAVAGVAAESRTCTVKVAVPLAVGVPEITPLEAFRVSPAGSVPTVIDHE